MKTLRILFIEPISKHSLKRYIQACKKNNWCCDILITKNNKLNSNLEECDNIIHFDSLNQKPEELISIICTVKYDAIIPASEFSVPMAEELSHRLGLYHNPLDKVSGYRDKSIMRYTFNKYGIDQPNILHVISNIEDFKKIDLDALTYPVVAKPTEAAGSVMVRICNNAEEVNETVMAILEFNESRVTSLSFNNKAILEEAILGPEYSVEILINNNEVIHSSITTKFLSHPPLCDEVGHIVGISLPQHIEEKVEKNIERLKQAWEIQNGVIHAEFKLSNDKIYFIEAGARIAGDMISELVELTYGINLEEAFILSRALESIPSVERKEDLIYGVRFIFNRSDVERIKNAKFLESSDMDYNIDLLDDCSDTGFSSRKGYAIVAADKTFQNEMKHLIEQY